MKYSFHIVDVFSRSAFGGNQLAVLPEASGLSVEGMQKIAREFNFAETTFVMPAEQPDHTRRVRIFIPKAELPSLAIRPSARPVRSSCAAMSMETTAGS